MRPDLVRTLCLVGCTFTFLLVGAAVFDTLEAKRETRTMEVVMELKQALIDKYKIEPDDFSLMEVVIRGNRSLKNGPQWNFAGAFYFATIVLAMIGYGHATPVTVAGKAFCMVYAIVGIPLCLIMFQSIGERLNVFSSILIRRIKRRLGCNNEEATELNLMFASGFMSSAVITVGAAMFSKYEGWSYFDSFYYCFITLTTIGFGDYVALQNDNALTEKPGYVILCLVFILFGLAVVAACINLLVLRFMTLTADGELQGVSEHVITGDGEEVTSVNGELLAGHAISRDPADYGEQESVCTCTCVGSIHYDYGRVVQPEDYRDKPARPQGPVPVLTRLSI